MHRVRLELLLSFLFSLSHKTRIWAHILGLYKADPSSHHLDDPSGCLHVWVLRTTVLNSKREDGGKSIPLNSETLTTLLHFPHLASLLFSSCFSQAATDWPPNKAGHHQIPDNCVLLPAQGSIQDSIYMQSAKYYFCKLSDSTPVTLRSSGMHFG